MIDLDETGNVFAGEITYEESDVLMSERESDIALNVGETRVMPDLSGQKLADSDYYVSVDDTTGMPVKQVKTASVLNASATARMAARKEAAEAIAMLSSMEDTKVQADDFEIPEITYNPEDYEDSYEDIQEDGEEFEEDEGLSEDSYQDEDDIEPEDEFEEDDDLTPEEEEELGDLSYHDEDVKPVRKKAPAAEKRKAPRAPSKDSNNKKNKSQADRRKAALQAEEAMRGRKKPAAQAEEAVKNRKKTSSKAEEAAKAKKRPATPAPEVKKNHKKPVQDAGRKASSKSKNLSFDDEDDERGGFLSNLTWIDYSIAAVAVLVVIIACIGISMLNGNKSGTVALDEFTEIGSKLGSLSGIGNDGIDNVVAIAERTLIESEIPEGETPTAESVAVSVNFVSLEKDLKVKFINKDTGELLTGVGFKIDVSDPSNKSSVWEDDDRDGIIYKNELKAGIYMISVEDIGEYDFPDDPTPVTVKDKLTYTAIYIRDEIKKETDIDASKEDTENKGDIETGETLPDTVDWVESSKIAETKYVPVDYAKDIAEPKAARVDSNSRNVPGASLASANSSENHIMTMPWGDPDDDDDGDDDDDDDDDDGGDVGPGGGEEPPADTKHVTSVSLDETKMSMLVGDTSFLTETVLPENCEDKSVSWKSSDDKVVSVSNGVVKALKAGKATITVTTNAKNTEGKKVSATCEVTVVAPEEIKLSIDFESAEMKVGEEKVLTAKVTNADDESVTFSSSNEKVCKVDSNGKIKALAEGEAIITVRTVEKNSKGDKLEKTCKITVKNANSTDNVSTLKTKDGKVLYVKDGDSYREAKYADYYKTKEFFVKEETYRYTGWQTIEGATYYYDKTGKYVTGEQVILGVKYTFANNGVLNMNGAVLGIDVSKWNGSIDWNAVKSSGVSFVIIRCGYRGSATGVLVEDPQFETYIKGATNAGLKVGLYFFTQAVSETEAVEEASMCVTLAKNYKISYPIFIDTELTSGGRANGLDKNTRTAVVKAFCETIKSSGYTPGVYASKSWYNDNLNASSLSAYKIWLAQYASSPSYSGRYDLWQNSCSGKVKGISGKVDMDISYLGY